MNSHVYEQSCTFCMPKLISCMLREVVVYERGSTFYSKQMSLIDPSEFTVNGIGITV